MPLGRTRRLAGRLALASLALCLGAAASAQAAAVPPTTAAEMYEPGRIVAIDLTLPPESIEELEAEPKSDKYVPGTFSLAATDGSPLAVGGFSPPLSVGIRLKGGIGSFRDLSGKAAFKIKFNELVKGQTFLGLKKMTLNNMVQDPSMVREVRAYESFRALGVPAPNAGYAFVRVNGDAFGTYLNLETLDDLALEKRFGPFDDPQHLYEGEYGDDVTPELEAGLEVDEGDEKETGDLKALVAAVNDPGAGWLERVEAHADLLEMARMWAVEKYIGHWDGYSGFESTLENPEPNNYYLYSDAAGRFQMLPWGTDQTWDERLDFEGPGGVLFNDCLADAGCEAIYRAAALEVLRKLPKLDLSTKTRCTAEALRPFQEAEAAAATETRVPPSAELIADRVHADRVFMESRATELAEWLGVAAPSVDHSEHPCVEPERVTPPPPGRAEEPIELGKVTVSHGILRAYVFVAEDGSVDLNAGIKTRFGPRHACGRRGRQVVPGFAAIRCRLRPLARGLLATRSARMTVGVRFLGADGSKSSDTRRISAPRSGARVHPRR